MIRPYLIQRANFTKREGTDIESILDFQYMGSAEFEWVALPKSLKRIREYMGVYFQIELTLDGYEDKPIVVLCKESQKDDIPKVLQQLADQTVRLKEYCDLWDYLQGKENISDFWWDIENDYFFWRSDEEFNETFSSLLFKDIE